VGTSHRVVRKVIPLPDDSGSSTRPDLRVCASFRKHESFTSSSLRISAFRYFERAPILEQMAACRHNFRFPNTIANAPEPAPKGLATRKVYGFPTVSLAPVFSQPTLAPRTRQKLHSLPRAREEIPCRLSHSPRPRCFRLARM
jgi:hypothetical protein